MNFVMAKHLIPATVALLGLVCTGPAEAVDGEVLITQADALAGNVTPGDAPGFPVTLSLSGSYKLASNLAVNPEAIYGIVADAADIRIDLDGFTISGGGKLSQTNPKTGIKGNNTGLTVKNGTITNFRASGIEFFSRRILMIDNMVISSNGIYGIDNLNSAVTLITNSILAFNRLAGLRSCNECLLHATVVSPP